MALETGGKFPKFALPDENGNLVKLSDFQGKRLVLFFYPKAGTSGCTQEAIDFRDEVASFKKKNAAVIGISKDEPEAQKKFKHKNALPFPLLSDQEAELQKELGIWKEKNMYGRKVLGTERTTVVVDPDGKVEKIYPKVKVEGHVEQVLADL